VQLRPRSRVLNILLNLHEFRFGDGKEDSALSICSIIQNMDIYTSGVLFGPSATFDLNKVSTTGLQVLNDYREGATDTSARLSASLVQSNISHPVPCHSIIASTLESQIAPRELLC